MLALHAITGADCITAIKVTPLPFCLYIARHIGTAAVVFANAIVLVFLMSVLS